MKTSLAWALILALTILLGCSCGYTPNLSIDTTGHTIHHAEITVEGYGIITVALDETVAPITVQNFIYHACE